MGIINKTTQQLNDIFAFISGVPSGDDKGVQVTGGQFSVGSVSDPRETCLGAGDSYPAPKVYHCTLANTTGQTITGATDITTIVGSDAGSTIGLFGGNTAGNYILIGADDATFSGLKIKYDTLGIVEPENISGAYLGSDGNPWVNALFMGTNSNFPYDQNGWKISLHDSEQILFGFDPITLGLNWQKTTLNINGANETRYWGRFVLDTAVTTEPIVEQIKIHTSRTEVEETGFMRVYGRGRYPRTLISGIQNTIKNDNFDPPNEAVNYTSNYSADFVDNEFANGLTDGFGIIQNVLSGLDTSIPLVLSVSYYVKGIATGDIEFEIEATQVDDGFIYDGSSTPDTSYTQIEQVLSPSNLQRKTVNFLIPINKVDENGAVVISLQRNGGAATDTLGANIVIANISLRGFFWHM